MKFELEPLNKIELTNFESKFVRRVSLVCSEIEINLFNLVFLCINKSKSFEVFFLI